MAASWAQYQAQDALIKLVKKLSLPLHGRGGSVGPWRPSARAALLFAAPPGQSEGGLRARDRQGEMIASNTAPAGSHRQQPVALHQRNSGSKPAARRRNRAAGVILWMSFPSSLWENPTAVTCAKIKTCTVLPLRDAGTRAGQVPLGSRPAKRRRPNWRRRIAARDSVDLQHGRKTA